MEDIDDMNKRIVNYRNKTEQIKAELQDLINEGLGKTSKVQQQNEEPRQLKDSLPTKVQISRTYDGQCSNQLPNKEKVSQIQSKKECPKKVKSYNVEEAREYIKKQRLKRLEQLKSSTKDNKVQLEIKQKKLQQLHEKAIGLLQRNVEAKRRSRSKSRERTDCIRLDIDRLPRSRSASKISAINSEARLQPMNEIYTHRAKEHSPQDTISKNQPVLPSSSIKVLQNITLIGGSDCIQESNVQETEGLSPRDVKLGVQCDSVRISKETQTAKCENHFPKWLQEIPIESSPHNVINTFRKKLECAANCPKLNMDVGVQNSIGSRKLKDLPELKLSTKPQCLNLDPKTVEHFELKPSTSPNNLSGSDSGTSKNIPDISSESGATLKKTTDVKDNLFSDVSLSINTYKIDNMQLKKGKTITIQSSTPVVIITDEDGYCFDHQRLEDRKHSIISSGSPEGQGYKCSKNMTSSSTKTDIQHTPKHSKNIPNCKSNCNKTKPHSVNSSNKSNNLKSPSQLSKSSSKTNLEKYKFNKSTPQSSDSTNSKNHCQKSPSHISKSCAHNLQRPDIFVNTKRGSGVDSVVNDFFEENGKSETLISDSDVSTAISLTNRSTGGTSSVRTEKTDIHAAAEIMPLKEPTVSLSIIGKNKMIHDDDKSRVLKNICVRTNREDENPNEIHLKFEAEIHLLNDFNESLRQFVEVEKAFETLKNNSVNKRYAETKDTQTSVKSFDNSDHRNKENSIISSVNYSRGSTGGAPINSALESSDSSVVFTGLELSNMEVSQKSSSIKSSVEAVHLINNGDDHFTKMSLNLFEQLIKDEDARLENLKTILKIREQALLDRTKGELAWLEIQRKHLKETGNLQEASTIKKKQRGILLNLQKEKNEMQRLKQMQKAASVERKTALKEQSRQLRKNLVTTNMMSKMRINTPRERRLSGPIKVLQSKTESIRSETSMSRISSTDREKEVYSIASHQSIVSRVSEFSEIDVSSKAIESEVENKQASIRKNLLMKEAALSKRRKAAEELLQCHQKLLEEEKRVVELESMAKSIICPKSDATKKRKTWSLPAPISLPKQSEKTSIEYASDFEVESIVDAVDQNIKDLMSDFNKVQDNISMLGISKSSKSDEDECKEEENSVIETKKTNKNSTGTISSISTSLSGSVAPELSGRLSKTFCVRTSMAASHIDPERSIHTIQEQHSVALEVSEKISNLSNGSPKILAPKASSPNNDKKYSAVSEVSEKLSSSSNDVSKISASKVSANISKTVSSKTSESDIIPVYSEKLSKSMDDGLGILTAKYSSQGKEKTEVSNEISESPNLEREISDVVLSYKSSVNTEIPEKPLKSEETIKSDIVSELKSSVEISEEVLNALQRQNNTSDRLSSAASLYVSNKGLPLRANLSGTSKTKANSHNADEIISEESYKKRSESNEMSVEVLNSAQKGKNDITKSSISTAPLHRSNRTLSKYSSNEVSVVPDVSKQQSDSLSGIKDLSDTSKTSHSSDRIVSEKISGDVSQSAVVLEEVLNSSQERSDNASIALKSVTSTHISDKSLPENASKEVSDVPEILNNLSDSFPETTDLSDTKKTSNDSKASPSKDSIKKTSSVPGRSLEVSIVIKNNGSIASLSEVTPKAFADLSSDPISERLAEVAIDDQKESKTETSETLSNINSAEFNGNVLATAADEIIQLPETSNNKVLHENEMNDALKSLSNGVSESLLGSAEVKEGLIRVTEVTEGNESSKVLSSDAPISVVVVSKNIDENPACKSKISGIIEEALQEVYSMDETLYKYFKRNSSVSTDKTELINQNESVKITSNADEDNHMPCGSENILQKLQNDEEVDSRKTVDSVDVEKSIETIPVNEKCLTNQAVIESTEINIAVVGNEDKGYSRAELGENELKNIIHDAVKKGLFSVLENAAKLNRTLDGSVLEHFAETAGELDVTGLRLRTDEDINVSCTTDEAEQRSLGDHLESLKETDIDEELSLDASEAHNITPHTVPNKNTDTSISKSSSNREILDLSYGALETSFTKEEINSYEEKEQDSLSPQNDDDPVSVEEPCSVTRESVKNVDVKKRVSEIMADANLTRGDKSPRLQDIYTTTYDLASPAISPEYGSPVDVCKTTAPVSIFGEEAEEIFKKQLAIEQEIKAITEQQQKEQQLPFVFVREIPNKPPPPYTPPSSQPPVPPVQPIVPTKEEIDEITKYASKILYKAHIGGKLDKVTISDSTLNLIGTTISKDRYRFVFDLCKEICRWHYGQFEDSTSPSWLRITRKPKLAIEKPLDAAGLEKHMTKKLRELYGYEKPIIRENAIIKWCKKKRNNIDEILITESLQEEPQWTNFEKDDKLVMDQVTNEIMNMLLMKETEEVFRNVFCRKIL